MKFLFDQHLFNNIFMQLELYRIQEPTKHHIFFHVVGSDSNSQNLQERALLLLHIKYAGWAII